MNSKNTELVQEINDLIISTTYNIDNNIYLLSIMKDSDTKLSLTELHHAVIAITLVLKRFTEISLTKGNAENINTIHKNG